MATHSTNYCNTFIAVAPDCPVEAGTPPPSRKTPSASERAFAMVFAAPYAHTSDDVLFTVFADRKNIPPEQRDAARAAFFAKPQACMRASDLAKKYGWGVHHDHEGHVALVPMQSQEYEAFASGQSVCPTTGEPVTVKFAMRSKRASPSS